MNDYNDDGLSCIDARRILFRTMRDVQGISDRLADLVSPWENFGVVGDFASEAF